MFFDVTTTIEERLRDEWTQTEIDFDNVEFTPVRGTPFIRLQTEWTDTNTIAVGRRDRGEGYINISVYIPSNLGYASAASAADLIAVIFDRFNLGSLQFGVARMRRVGQQESWFRVDVITPFQYDRCVAA